MAPLPASAPCHSPRRLHALARAALACLALAAAGAAPAQTLYWDANGSGAGTGGTGAWNTFSTTWSDSASGTNFFSPGRTWPGSGATAIFGGTAGTVALGGALFANNLTFQTSGYTLDGTGSVAVIGLVQGVGTTTLAAQVRSLGENVVALQGRFNLAGNDALAGSFNVLGGTLLTVQADFALRSALVNLNAGASIDWGTRRELNLGGLILDGTPLALGERQMTFAGVAGQSSLLSASDITGGTASALQFSGGSAVISGNGGGSARTAIAVGKVQAFGSSSTTWSGVDLNLMTARPPVPGALATSSLLIDSTAVFSLRNGTRASVAGAAYVFNSALLNIASGSTATLLADNTLGLAGTLLVGGGAGAGVATVSVDGNGSRLDVADALFLGSDAEFTGTGRMRLRNGATASAPLLAFGLNGSTLSIGAGSQFRVNSFLQPGGPPIIYANTSLQIDGTFVYGDPALTSGRITAGLIDQFDGVLSGDSTGLLRKVGNGTLTLNNPASTFAGAVQLEAGTLRTSITALKNAKLTATAGSTGVLTFTDRTATSTITLGALDGAFALDLGGADLQLGGANQSGSFSGWLNGGGVTTSISKIGVGTQVLDLRRQGTLAPMLNLAAGAGTLRLAGGNTTFTATGSTGFGGASSVFVEFGSALELTQGAVLNSWSTPQLHNNGTLLVDGGAQFNVLRVPGAPFSSVATLRIGYAGGTSVLTVQAAGSKLMSQDAIDLGSTFPGTGRLVLGAGASATVPVLRILSADSSLAIGVGGSLSVNRLVASELSAAFGSLSVDGTLNVGDETLASPQVALTTRPSFGGAFSGSGTLNKLGSSYFELLSAGGGFSGDVNLAAGTLSTAADTLRAARLTVRPGATWRVDALSSLGTVQVGGLWGSGEIGLDATTLSLGGGGQSGSYAGRFTTGQVALVKTGGSAQDFVRIGQTDVFTAPYLSARGGSTNLVGGRFDFSSNVPSSANAFTASINVSGPGSRLRLLQGADVTATSRLYVQDGGSLLVSDGSRLNVRTTGSGDNAVFVGLGSSGLLAAASGATLSTGNVLLYQPNTGAAGTFTLDSGARANVGFVQFETDQARTVVNGGSLQANGGYFVRTPASFAGSIALSDPAGGAAALTLGSNWGAGEVMYAFNGRITDAAGGPGSIQKQGAGTLPLAKPLEITGRLIVDGGRVQPSSVADLKTVQVVLNSKDGIDFSLLGTTLGANLRPALGALSGAADLMVPNTNLAGIEFGETSLSGRFTGRIVTTGQLVKRGAGTQTFAGGGQARGWDVFGGGVVVDGGAWQLAPREFEASLFVLGPNAWAEVRGGAQVNMITRPGQIDSQLYVGGASGAAPARVTVTGEGTRVTTSALTISRDGTVDVNTGANVVAELGLSMFDASSLLVINRGFVRTKLVDSANGRITVSDAPPPSGTSIANLRTGLTLVSNPTTPGGFSFPTLNVPISDGPSGAGGVTFSGSNFFVFITAAQTYTGPTVVEGPGAFVGVPAGNRSTDLVARQGGNVSFLMPSTEAFDATGKTLRTDATGTVTYNTGQAFTGGTLLGPGHGLATNASVAFNGSTIGTSGVLTVAAGARTTGTGLQVAGGTLVNQGTVQTPLSVDTGGRAQGTGTFGAVTLNAGGTFAPGNSTARVNTGAVVLNGGARYEVEITNASGAAGTGFDQWFVTGGTSFAASAASPFTVVLQSLGAGMNAGGLASSFDPTRAYRWAVLSTDTLAGPTGTGLALDTTAWANATAGGSFSLAWANNAGRSELNVIFAPVPEPGTWALMLGGVAGLALFVTRRRHAAGRAFIRTCNPEGAFTC